MDWVNSTTPVRTTPRNHLLGALASLSPLEYQRIKPSLRPVRLPAGTVLYETEVFIERVFFLDSGLASLVLTSEVGTDIEVGMIGSEGMVGIMGALGGGYAINRAVMQIAGSGYMLPQSTLMEEFKRGGMLQEMLLRYLQVMLAQSAQTALCNRLHTVEAKLCRWLLTIADRVDSDRLALTQELVASMLGVRRAGITVAAGTLREAGLIDYTRGAIHILNRPGLETCACECYENSQTQLQLFLNAF